MDYDDDWLMIKLDSLTDYAKGKVVAYISKTFAIKITICCGKISK